jgi:transcriptional regulator with XRE-family HTH domain
MKKLKRFASIGNRLKKMRGPLSQKEFAKRIGVSLPAYQRYEAGERMLKDEALYRIAAICKMPIEWILSGQIKRFYVENTADLKKLIRLEDKKKKTNEDLEKIDAIKDKSYKEALRRSLSITGGYTPSEIEEYIESRPKPLHKYFEQMGKVKFSSDVKPSPLLVMIKQIERIYNEGNKIKINAIKSQLDALDPEGKAIQERKSIK